MVEKQVLCKSCGQPFVSESILSHVRKTVQEKNLAKLQDYLELCQKCRGDTFARYLIGDDLKPIKKVKTPVKRRTEPVETVKEDPKTGCTIYKSECAMCNSYCDAKVYVKDGKVVKVEGDLSSETTKGILCAKGLSSKDLIYHPDRLLHPLKRVGERGEGKWQQISWDEALDTVANRLKETEEKYGKDGVGLATGTARGFIGVFWRFGNLAGWQTIGPGMAQCWLPRTTGSVLVTGAGVLESPHYPDTNCMMIWGGNPPLTYPVKGRGMMEAKARGVKMIVVDPVLSETASKADLWLQLRPGTDPVLALGMLNVIINEGLYDKEFVDKWCVGFDELRERVQEYSPERAEEITWVPREKIREAARMYATTKPATLEVVVAIEEIADTISIARALASLICITGNYDVPGGNVVQMPVNVPGTPEMIAKDQIPKERHERRCGSKEYPFLAGEVSIVPTAHSHTFWKAVLTGKPYPIRALYCAGSNMLSSYANTKMVKKALLSLDFFAIADVFMTETCKLADIVLPAATWMERDFIHTWYQVDYNTIHLEQKVTEVEDCKTDTQIVRELANRLGFGHLMYGSDEEYCDFLLKNWNITFQEFKKKGVIIVPYTWKKYEKEGFKTPTGKVELYSQRLKDMGFDPLPGYVEPSESPYSTPDVAKEYPLIITTGGRVSVFRHAEYRNFPKFREIVPNLEMMINPKTAKELGIADGDRVIVESPRGQMEAFACLNESIDPRVVQVPSHWEREHNVNLIMDNEKCAPLIGTAQYRCQLCRVRRAS